MPLEAIYLKGNYELSSWAKVYDFREGVMKCREDSLEQIGIEQFGTEEPQSQEITCPHPSA